MSDVASPNLPSRDFERTSRFYTVLGFTEVWRDDGWIILKRGDPTLEYLPHPKLDPLNSWFSCCLRLDDLDSFYGTCKGRGCRKDVKVNLDFIFLGRSGKYVERC